MHVLVHVCFISQPRNRGSSYFTHCSIRIFLEEILAFSASSHVMHDSFSSFRWARFVSHASNHVFSKFVLSQPIDRSAPAPMDRALPIVQTLTLAELIQLLIVIANRIQLLSGPPCNTYTPPPRARPQQEPVGGFCGCQCMICGAPCGRQKAGHTHHRCYQHRHQ